MPAGDNIYHSKHGIIEVTKDKEDQYRGHHIKTGVKCYATNPLDAYKNTMEKLENKMEEAKRIVLCSEEREVPKKYDNGKPRLDLIRPEFTLGLGEALAYGAEKYEEPVGDTPNYLKGQGFNYSRITASLERHIQQWKMGKNIDEESGLHHLKMASANIMFLLTYELTGNGIDDRVILGEFNEAEKGFDSEAGKVGGNSETKKKN